MPIIGDKILELINFLPHGSIGIICKAAKVSRPTFEKFRAGKSVSYKSSKAIIIATQVLYKEMKEMEMNLVNELKEAK